MIQNSVDKFSNLGGKHRPVALQLQQADRDSDISGTAAAGVPAAGPVPRRRELTYLTPVTLARGRSRRRLAMRPGVSERRDRDGPAPGAGVTPGSGLPVNRRRRGRGPDTSPEQPSSSHAPP